MKVALAVKPQGVVIVDWPGAENSPLYSWKDEVGAKFVGVDEGGVDWIPPADTVLVISAQTYSMPHITILRRCVERGIPVLTLADGILEFRNTWRNPENPPGTLFMPVIGHKMACLGRAQAARIASWGNKGVCEVVGMPVFDNINWIPPKRQAGTKFRLLVATASTAWFDDNQKETTLASLRDLCEVLAGRPDIEVWWRLSKAAAESLGVVNHVANFSDMPMERCIDLVDAVVSTPSTLLLYPMLQGKPAVALDYSNLPQYCRFAWTASAREHLAPILLEITRPAPEKLIYQKQLLDEELEWRGSAGNRLFTLIRGMADIGRAALKEKVSPEFPSRIVSLDGAANSPVFDSEWDEFFGRNRDDSVAPQLLAELARHRQATARLLKHNKWLEEQRLAWMGNANDKDAKLTELTNHSKWLEGQRLAWMDNANGKDAKLTELAETADAMRQQCMALQSELATHAARIEVMTLTAVELEGQVQMFCEKFEQMRRRARCVTGVFIAILLLETVWFVCTRF